MTNSDNLNEERQWLENELSKRKDKKWLRYSSQVARRILAALREKEDITQKELANKIGVTPQYISKVLKGQENLTLETISKLSEALGVELISFPRYQYSALPSFVSIQKGQTASVIVSSATYAATVRSDNTTPMSFGIIKGNLGMAEKIEDITIAI